MILNKYKTGNGKMLIGIEKGRTYREITYKNNITIRSYRSTDSVEREIKKISSKKGYKAVEEYIDAYMELEVNRVYGETIKCESREKLNGHQ